VRVRRSSDREARRGETELRSGHGQLDDYKWTMRRRLCGIGRKFNRVNGFRVYRWQRLMEANQLPRRTEG